MTVSNAELFALARLEAARYPARTYQRRAAAALAVALQDTRTVDAAKRALKTFTEPRTEADALALLAELATRAGRSTPTTERHQPS